MEGDSWLPLRRKKFSGYLTWHAATTAVYCITIDFGWTGSATICKICWLLILLQVLYHQCHLDTFRGSKSSWKTQGPCRQREGKSSLGSSFLCPRSLPGTNSFPGKPFKDFIKSGLHGPCVRLWWITLILENSQQVVIPCVTSRIGGKFTFAV